MMPNTPCLVGASASAMCLGGQASEEDGEAVRTLFDAVGTIFKVRRCACRAGPTEHDASVRQWPKTCAEVCQVLHGDAHQAVHTPHVCTCTQSDRR